MLIELVARGNRCLRKSGRVEHLARFIREVREVARVEADADQLRQVVLNLVLNALDAMAGSGTLTVRTARDGDCALVEIGDTGPGIPEELRRRVFEPFFTTKPVGQGTGLGLDVSWRIVTNRHGGDLRVVSEPGDTRFQVRLPLTEPSAADAAAGSLLSQLP